MAILTFILLVVPGMQVTAVYYNQYTIKNALISNNVYATFRDSRGYMWFGTDKGISRFDGKTFKNYTIRDGIGDNEIFNFFEDKYRRMWLMTYNGENCYLRNDSIFNKYNDPLLKKMPVKPYMNVMLQDNDTLYIGYRYGELLKICGQHLQWIKTKSTILDPLALYKSGSKIYYVGDSIVNIIENGRVLKKTISKTSIKSGFFNNKLFVFDHEGIKVYKDEVLIRRYNSPAILSSHTINTYVDTAENIFISTFNGLYILTPQNELISLFAGQQISKVAQDICGNYWVASFGNGIYCINKELENIKYHIRLDNRRITYTRQSQLLLHQNDTLFRFVNDIFRQEKQPRRVSNIKPVDFNDSLYFINGIPSSGIYNIRTGHFYKNYNSTKWAFPLSSFNYLLVSNQHGECYNINFTHKTSYKIDSFVIGARIFHALHNKWDNNVYLLYSGGLHLYDKQSRSLTLIDSTISSKTIINAYTVEQYLIFLTNNNSLLVYNVANKKRYTELETGELAIYNLVAMHSNKYLAYTNKGIYVLYVNLLRPPYFSFHKQEYPFKSDEVFDVYKVSDKLVCNVKGELYSIDEKLLNKVKQTPSFLIQSVTVNDVPYYTNSIVLPHAAEATVRFTVSTLHFNNARNYYQFRLYNSEGEGQWNKTEGDELNISIPQHGNYKIELRAITENNVCSSSIFYKVNLLPPFYYTSWFKGLLILLGASSIMGVVYIYNSRRRKILQEQLNYLKNEQRAVSTLLNPHFTFNAINNIQTLVNENAAEKANDYLAILSKLLRQNMENLQFSLVPLQNELDLVSNYTSLQNLRFDNRIKCIMNIHLSEYEIINIPPLLIHTFVENAIIHGFNKTISNFIITVDVSTTFNDYLVIVIKDNGVGLSSSEKSYSHLNEKTSLGISITRQRLEKLSRFYKKEYFIEIDNAREGAGTEVRLILYAKFKEPFA